MLRQRQTKSCIVLSWCSYNIFDIKNKTKIVRYEPFSYASQQKMVKRQIKKSIKSLMSTFPLPFFINVQVHFSRLNKMIKYLANLCKTNFSLINYRFRNIILKNTCFINLCLIIDWECLLNNVILLHAFKTILKLVIIFVPMSPKTINNVKKKEKYLSKIDIKLY